MPYQLRKKLVALVLPFAFALAATGQGTQANIDPDADFKLAKELYLKDQYSLAYPIFKDISRGVSPYSKLPISVQLEAKYYTILGGLQLNETTAEPAAMEFIALEHHTPRIQMLSYHLGEYYFRRQDFNRAMEYYDKAGIDNLNNSEIAAMKFHQAYGYFTMQQFEKAKPLFNSIRQMPNDPNYLDAHYYYGFISFYEKNYDQALESFRKVENHDTYQKIVPYYITEILYFKGDKDRAIAYGEEKLAKGNQYYHLQLRQLVGHAYFEKRNFSKALPYLEAYVQQADKVRREDLYELSYAYYESNQLTKAIPGFKELGGKDDSLAQNSMYLLADAYLKTGQKANARSAFLFCASNSSNPVQKEISQFNYAKLSYELGFQDVALNEFQAFLRSYPNAAYANEAKELLVSILANTNNYQEALALYESLGAKSETVKQVYPRMLYGRAVEYINDQQLDRASQLLDQLMAAPYNSTYLPYTWFWKGELALRNNQVDGAIEYFNNYLRNPVTSGEVNVNNARYNLGYAHFTKGNYPQALGFYQQVTRSVHSGSPAVEQDAYVRSADAYFMNRNYRQAQEMYDNVIAYNFPSADYALYQKGIIAGANNRTSEKVALLQSLENKYPASPLVAEANMEIADTYLAEEDFRDAIEPLKRLLRNKKATALHPQAYLKLGVAYFNLDNSNEALVNFKTLISSYPDAPESDAAVDYVRNIFIQNQQAGEFVSFMRSNGKDISYSEEDSLTYASALVSFNNNEQAKALTAFRSYLDKFPNGRYSLDASYYVANIYNTRKDYPNAVIGYEYVATRAPNKYAEKAVLQAARISFFELKDYAAAERYFAQLKDLATTADVRLESMRGLLRAQYRLNKWKEAVPNAEDLLTQKGIATDDKMMAYMVLAKNNQNNGQTEQALTNYRTVIAMGKSEFAAEARYRLAEIQFQQGRMADAEKAAFDVINKAGSYEYWITKAYILLGDVYWKQKDYFNAEATFKSVSENATVAELKEEARVKLDAVIDDKNKQSKVTN